MLKDKLQRKGSQINVAPKWHEFVKEWDQFLEEPPSLLFFHLLKPVWELSLAVSCSANNPTRVASA